MADPTLEIRDANRNLVAANDDWKIQDGGSDALDEIYISNFAPTNDRESAVIVTLNPGAYTALVRGKAGTTGMALVEVYDLQQDSSQIVNVSTRGRVETDDNVMIGGFIVRGIVDTKVLIKVSGPSLTAFGLPADELLADPMLEIYNQAGVMIASSDNWRDGEEADYIAADPHAPVDDMEPAVILTLPPGEYTAIARGKNRTSGIGVVEVYQILP